MPDYFLRGLLGTLGWQYFMPCVCKHLKCSFGLKTREEERLISELSPQEALGLLLLNAV